MLKLRTKLKFETQPIVHSCTWIVVLVYEMQAPIPRLLRGGDVVICSYKRMGEASVAVDLM